MKKKRQIARLENAVSQTINNLRDALTEQKIEELKQRGGQINVDRMKRRKNAT